MTITPANENLRTEVEKLLATLTYAANLAVAENEALKQKLDENNKIIATSKQKLDTLTNSLKVAKVAVEKNEPVKQGAILNFVDDNKKKIVNTSLYGHETQLFGNGLWISDNVYVVNLWEGWWFAYFEDKYKVRIGFSKKFSGTPTLDEIVNFNYTTTPVPWTGNLQSITYPNKELIAELEQQLAKLNDETKTALAENEALKQKLYAYENLRAELEKLLATLTDAANLAELEKKTLFQIIINFIIAPFSWLKSLFT